MSNKDDGGPAFPVGTWLRDYVDASRDLRAATSLYRSGRRGREIDYAMYSAAHRMFALNKKAAADLAGLE